MDAGKEIILKGIEALYDWADGGIFEPLESVFASLSLSSGESAEHRYLPLRSLSEQINYPRGSPEAATADAQKWQDELSAVKSIYDDMP